MDQQFDRLRRDAAKCRDLASTALTPDGREILFGLAEQYESRAAELTRFDDTRRSRRSAFNWTLDAA